MTTYHRIWASTYDEAAQAAPEGVVILDRQLPSLRGRLPFLVTDVEIDYELLGYDIDDPDFGQWAPVIIDEWGDAIEQEWIDDTDDTPRYCGASVLGYTAVWAAMICGPWLLIGYAIHRGVTVMSA